MARPSSARPIRNGLLIARGFFVALAIIGNLLPQEEEDNATASDRPPQRSPQHPRS